jgi:DNA repair exonuclease SbcCD ATPase subunit
LAAESNSETIEKLKQDLEQREKLFEEMSMSWEDKLAKSDKLIEEMKSREVELREQLASVDDSTAKLQNKIKLRDLEIAELKATLRIAKSSESSKVEALEAKIKLNERVFNETIETLKREHENAINKLSMDIISTARQEKEELEARYKDIVEKSKQEVSVSYEAKIGAIKLALEDKNAEIADLMKTMGEEVQLIGQQYSDQHVRGTTTLKSAFQKKVASIMEEIEMNNQTHKETMERMMTRHEQQLKEKEEAHDKFVKEKEEKYHASLQEIQTSYDKLIKEKETSMHELQVTHDKLVKEKKIAEMRMSAFGISIKDLGNKVSRSASAASMTPEQK